MWRWFLSSQSSSWSPLDSVPPKTYNRSHMKRTPLKRRTRIKPRSRKREAGMVERHGLIQRLVVERPCCEFPVADKCALEGGRCGGYRCPNPPADVHEKLTRGRGGSITDESNVIVVCRPHHDWIHANPEAATELGLLIHSWQASPDVPEASCLPSDPHAQEGQGTSGVMRTTDVR